MFKKRLLINVHAVDKVISGFAKHLNSCSAADGFLIFPSL